MAEARQPEANPAPEAEPRAWAYLVRCADGSLYAGWTNDLAKRVAAHNAGTGAKYTRGRGPVALCWAQRFATKGEAMAREAGLKRLPKTEKEALAAAWDGAGGEADGKE